MPITIKDITPHFYIDGKWVPGENGGSIDVMNPADCSLLASVADATEADAIKAVDAAEAALRGWRKTAPRKRAGILRRCFELMQRDAEALAVMISLENGKSLHDSRAEVGYAAEFFRWFAEEAVRVNGDISMAPNGNARIVVQYEPIGVSLLVTPWNYPAAMATRKIAPALAAGCTCILKPASETPLTAYAMAHIMAEAGVPDGVVNILTSSKSGRIVSAILDDPRVRKLSFTGSTAVGRILLCQAAKQVVNCSMELGGNAPVVIFDDADLDKAVEGVMIAKMRNGGEACTAANRIYAQSGIHDAFVAKFSERMAALILDDGIKETTDCGPLINAAALSTVSELVDDAVDRGARITAGGVVPKRKGYFYPPTVIADVPRDARMLHEEIFGPVAPVVKFDTEEEAIDLANQTEYGLVAYVFTENLTRGLRVCEQIEAGMLALNRGLVSDPAAPFGGVKQSGLGREGAHHGILEFMEAKYISVDW